MTVRNAISMFRARLFVIGAGPACEPSRRQGRCLAAIALAAFISPLGGCSDGSGGGDGSVDISKAKEAAKVNPDIAKAAAARGGALGDVKKGSPKKGR